ncbi:protein LBH-like isoform X2 [Carassius carassius]|uniref:protein LBH-like isoform X2 n=1 Tax=Carassius carassius TaxID=217509 RepID=UPI0028696E68|nr:protein LBH-like isoform X2 [Carassius carassius]
MISLYNRGMEYPEAQAMDEYPVQRNGDRLPFQIFPDPVEVVLSTEGCLTCAPQEKERQPSIMVEPTDISEVESGELRWPPEDVDFDEDEDLFLEQCIPPANIADWGEDEEQSSVIENHQQNTSLLDLQTDDFRDDTPTLPPESASTLN